MASALNNKKKKNKKKAEETAASQREEIILWAVLAFSIILLLSNFGIGGFVGNALSSLFFGIFGLVAYIFPICMVVLTAFFISNKGNKIAWIKVAAAVLFLILLCLFVELTADGSAKDSAITAFTYGRKERNGGGFFGGLFAAMIYPAFGLIGTYVIDIVGLIITLILITERSAFRGMKKGGQKVYHVANAAKEETEKRRAQRREQREEREEIQRLKRSDKKAVGVALDTAIKPVLEKKEEVKPSTMKKKNVLQEAESSDAMSEINIDDILQTPPVGEQEHIVLTSDREVAAQVEPLSEEMEISEIEVVPEVALEEPVKPESTPIVEPVPESAMGEKEEPVPRKSERSRQSEKEIQKDVSEIEEKVQQKNADHGRNYMFPPVDLLSKGSSKSMGDTREHLQETANKLQQTLKNFGVNVSITNVSCGPSVTRYELQPEMGVKVSKIVNLADDIKLNLAAEDIRIEAPIPGKAAIGIEVPNKETVTVAFRELIESEAFQKHPSKIAFAAGKDIGGNIVVADIKKMPHVLIAGATGSGKSVCINTIIMSILYKANPEDVKLIMIDPKVVELSVYNGIPHLFIPVVTDPKKASGALHWAVSEMTDRYEKFADYGVRDLEGYNQKVESIKDIDDESKPKKLPQIVIIVDELADLMMVAPGEVEDAICRLAQLARAAGIHLIIATQRPSVNVITGLIKANMPSRVAFAVTSGVDSRTILDMNGAEKLLGKGDMLFYPQGYSKPLRVQGAFVSDKEVQEVVTFLTSQNGETSYDAELEEKIHASAPSAKNGGNAGEADERDAYFADAAKLLIEKEKGSIGMLQRYFKIGFNRAARIMDQLEEAGIVGPEEGTKPRKVLMGPEEFEQYREEYL
ncbi:MAG: DNA translocase FtsK [Lachnospiraceae bacterium]|nr:DNA translocase FtsK [Lachnospiraceae bacterium]